MYTLIVKIFRKYPSCDIVEVSFDSRDKAYRHMQAWGNVLHDSMRRGEIETYGVELEEA